MLGGVAVLLPGLALPKEWAYAGMIFDLTGATVARTPPQATTCVTSIATIRTRALTWEETTWAPDGARLRVEQAVSRFNRNTLPCRAAVKP